MSNDINHLDTEDLGLKSIFGGRFHDDTCSKPAEVAEKKNIQATNRTENTANRVAKKSVDAQCEPTKTVTSMDKLKECAKWAGLFGGLSTLLFYWQQAGLLASEAAVPSLIVCALLAGLSIGWHAK